MSAPKRKREVQLNFRVSPEELALIEQKMAQLGTKNREAYLRKMALDGYVVRLELPELKELVSLMRYSSNNLNQLTRRVHETGRIYDADLEDISRRQEALWDGVHPVSYTHLGKLERKADMFSKRTIKPHEAVTTVDTASEALAVSISEKACVDMAYMEQLTGKTSEELAAELQGVIFRVPGQSEPDGTPLYVAADEYLSGNVRRKLRQAQRAAEQDPAFAVNVEALTAAQPKDLDASEIEVRLGATWIDKE